MSRIHAVDPSTATGQAKQLLDAVKQKLGKEVNMTRVLANSPAALDSYLSFSGSLSKGLLTPTIREQIALLSAQENHCNYCLSAHSALGKMAGLSPQQILESRQGNAADPRANAALTFARQLLDKKGQVTNQDVDAVRAAGFNDGEIVEIIAHVALNVFTNYFNTAAEVDIDFPKVSFSDLQSANA